MRILAWALVAGLALGVPVSALPWAASYPSSVKTFTTKATNDVIQAAHINDLQDEVTAIEQGLLNGLAHDLSPSSDSTYDLGTTSIRWAEVWADDITVTTSLTLAVAGLHLLDTNGSHDLILSPGSDLTADRTLTLTTGDAARTLTISGNATISQDYSTSGTPQFAQIGVGAAATAGGQLATLGTFAPASGNAFAFLSATSVSVPSGGVGGILLSNGTLTEFSSGTHALLSGLHIVAPTVTVGAATVTNTATLYVDGAMSATVTGSNYAGWFDSGTLQVDDVLSAGRIQVQTGLDGDMASLTLTCDSATEDTPAIGNSSFVRFTTAGGGNCILKGATAPTLGTGAHVVYALNATGQALVVNSEDASEGTAANRFVNIGALGWANGEAAKFVYDRTSSRWRIVR